MRERKEIEGEKERERSQITDHRRQRDHRSQITDHRPEIKDRERLTRPDIGVGSISLPPMSPPQP